nr:hypothetical protein [Tanacetum cinerariifolium]
MMVIVTLTGEDGGKGWTEQTVRIGGGGCAVVVCIRGVKTELFWPKEDPRSRLKGVFPHNISRPLHGVKLLGGPISVDADFSSALVMKRISKTIGLLDTVAKINDPQSSGFTFEEAICVFNNAMRIDFLSKPSEEDHTSDWICVVPISGLGQTMNAGKKVDIGLDGGNDKKLRPIDMLLYSWDKAIGYGFLHFSFTTLGELEADAVTLLKRIQKFSMAQDIRTRAAIHIFNMISFAIAKGVGAQIVSRLPSNWL